MNNYHTKQKEVVYNFLKDNCQGSYTSQELLDSINPIQEVSKATLYRILQTLTDDNQVRKFYNEKEKRYEYQYANFEPDCSYHLHLRCRFCGKLIHLECKEAKEFITHIQTEHGFIIDNLHSVIYGICPKCQEKGKKL